MGSFKVKGQHVYLDKKSVEKRIGIKKKYKLAGYQVPLPGLHHPQLFWILTSKPGRSSNDITVVIKQSHWQKFDTTCLKEPKTYLSHNNCEQLTQKEIRIKRKDRSNGFLLKARLNDSKFEEFRDKLSKLKLSPTRKIEDLKIIATSTTSTQNDANAILKQLRLA